MRLIVGLGNPGVKYHGTRHNIGFAVIDELIRRFATGGAQEKFQATCHDGVIGSEKVLLVQPLTFMNLSGESIWQFVRFYRTDPSDVVVICDDMNLPLGRIRWRQSGSAGGQKGLNDIVRRLGHQDIPRLRIGIGRPPGKMDVTAWVLSRFRSEEQAEVELAVMRAADSVRHWVSEGIEPTMCTFNRAEENHE